MKILLVASTYHPIIGGAESYARTLARGLRLIGHDVVVLTDGARVPGAVTAKVDDVVVWRVRRYSDALEAHELVRWEQMQFAVLGDAADLVAGEEFDLVHANGQEAAILGSSIALHLDAPLVCSSHEQTPELQPLGRGRCAFVHQHLPVAAFIVGSAFYEDKALGFGTEKARVRLVYHGIDVDQFVDGDDRRLASRDRFGVTDEDILIVCAARLSTRKGQADLVEAFRELRLRGHRAHLILAGTSNSGSASYVDALREQVRHPALADTATIREDLTLDDMPALFAAADIVVQPSYAEGLGLAALEAMAAGRAVVVSDIPGLREVVTDTTGVFFEPGDVAGLRESLARLADDPTLRADMGARARAHVLSRFGHERMARETADVYDDVIAEWVEARLGKTHIG